MKDLFWTSFAEGAARGVTAILLLPLTYGMLKLATMSGILEWANLPVPDNRQLVVAALAVAVFGR